jgi:hypothetical protein
MTIQKKDIDRIADALDKITLTTIPGHGDQTLSTRQTIRELAPILLKKKREGFNTRALVAMLESLKISIKGATLNRYLKEWQEERKKTRPKPAKGTSEDSSKRKSASSPAPETQVSNEPDPGGEHDSDKEVIVDRQKRDGSLAK